MTATDQTAPVMPTKGSRPRRDASDSAIGTGAAWMQWNALAVVVGSRALRGVCTSWESHCVFTLTIPMTHPILLIRNLQPLSSGRGSSKFGNDTQT